jgi:hypothetical protein
MSFNITIGLRLLPALSCALALFHPAAYANGERHEHGASALEVSIDNNTLQITWESPLHDLIGFEHAPKTPKQQAAAKKLLATLGDPAKVFAPNSEAACRVAKQSIVAPTLTRAHGHGAASSTDHDHAMHSELAYSVTYTCGNPKALTTLDIVAFKTWPAIQDIDVGLVGPGGQSAQEANPRSTQINLREVATKR